VRQVRLILAAGTEEKDGDMSLHFDVSFGELNSRQPFGWVRLGILEVEIVFSILVKFRGS
jgi:hypothetical protein